jgi:hypothetical protein
LAGQGCSWEDTAAVGRIRLQLGGYGGSWQDNGFRGADRDVDNGVEHEDADGRLGGDSGFRV